MNRSELAQWMLKWESVKSELDSLEIQIKSAVLELGESVQAGNVKAVYSGGRKTYNYQTAIEKAGLKPEVLKPFENIGISVDYRAACKEFDVADIPFTESSPSVSLKIV